MSVEMAAGSNEYVAEDKQVPPLRANPTIAQMKQHEEEKMKRDKVVTCLHSALTYSVFTSIMYLEIVKSIWDELKSRFIGMEDYKVVEKMLVSLPDKFETKVVAIEESCMFTTFDMNATTTVKLGNGDTMKATGKGKVLIQTKSNPKIINDVLYIPDLAQNLLSVAQLLKRGYSLIFEGTFCIILDFKKSEIVRIGKLHRKPNMNEDFNGDSSNESGFDDGAVADGKTRSLADVYEKCNMMVNEPSCYEEAAQMDEWKLAMKEELMMINKNQAQSSAEAEYIAAATASNQAIWIRKVLTHLNYVQEEPTELWCDNMSAISMAKNPSSMGEQSISMSSSMQSEKLRKMVMFSDALKV
ncbi:hypothetical protein EZV62_000976 [Acer yangbiense]|uniref:Retrovirus-related Pol polyprotein from transposon TNT 1-94-like beta-barrel domain-containing protein n=1 Tax=Acer yangbiense TaxID=1000413 RepID=A0A5C7ISS6_9ROSI|nr:hypothetical protein EZV62_000976 [Acer yangbiense]